MSKGEGGSFGLKRLLLSLILLGLIVLVSSFSSSGHGGALSRKNHLNRNHRLISEGSKGNHSTREDSEDLTYLPYGVDGYPLPQWIAEYQLFGQGIGYCNGYTSLAAFFAPNYPPKPTFPFLDIRGHYFEDDGYAVNVGVGARHLAEEKPWIFGWNGFYDYRGGGCNHAFHQIGFGVEAIGRRVGFQLNGYIPLGHKRRLRKCVFDDYQGGYFMINRQYETSFSGFNLAMSWMVFEKKLFGMDILGGTYFLAGRLSPMAWGGQVTIQARYSDYVSIGMNVSHDPIFGTLFQGKLEFILPLYRFSSLKNRKSVQGFSNRVIYQPVKRMEILPLEKRQCWESNF